MYKSNASWRVPDRALEISSSCWRVLTDCDEVSTAYASTAQAGLVNITYPIVPKDCFVLHAA